MSLHKIIVKGTGKISLHERFTQLRFDQKATNSTKASGPLWPGEDTRSSIPSLYVSHQLVRQDLRAELLLRKTGYSLRTGLQPRKALQRHSQDLDRVWRWTAGFNPAGDTIGASEFRKSLAYCHSLAFLLWQQILSQCTCASSPYSRTTGPPQRCF